MRYALWFLVACIGARAIFADPIPDAAKTAKGLDSALAALHAPTRNTKPLSPAESLARFHPRAGYAVDLIAAEPVVRQPLNIKFDARGRMWVANYAQYPFPQGLKVVEYDRYIRAKFDKTPLPPPAGDKGADFITIHESPNNDGTYSKSKVLLAGLNIATSVLPDRDGFWVMNPPYLLYYADANHDDVPDGDPIVHLSGFGLEDTHAVANSLTWGPDGWIYGAQGSTCTAKVRVHLPAPAATATDFLGQAIWRYHPNKHLFEIFAEGGGNTFGVEFDDKGRVYSGTNWSGPRGLHFVQGGYYVKGWGKHGPLTNPYAFGFFEHMPHAGNSERLTHTFSIYAGGLMPELTGKIIAPNSLQSRIQLTRLEPLGSTFKTIEEDPLMASDDGWFRPVDLKAGPDGAIYIADFYENRISHVDPRDTWDRMTGRIWRIRPASTPAPREPAIIDLTKLTPDQLLAQLDSPNRLSRSATRRLLAERNDPSLVATLAKSLTDNSTSPQRALESLWTLHLLRPLDASAALAGLSHADPSVRHWTIRFLADEKQSIAPALAAQLIALARSESNPEVRSQLASSAKRLPAAQALPILHEMLLHSADDVKDAFIPLLIWWAIESKLDADAGAVVVLFKSADLWKSPLVQSTIASRLARRLASGTPPTEDMDARKNTNPNPPDSSASRRSQSALLTLLQSAPTDADRAILLAGVNQAFDARPLRPAELLPELAAFLAKSGDLDLAARAGDPAAIAKLLVLVADDSATETAVKAKRTQQIDLLAQLAPPQAVPVLLKIASSSKWHSIRRSALSALTRFNDPSIASSLIANYTSLPKDQGVKPAALSTLLARKSWSLELLKAIDTGVIPKADLTPDHLSRLRANAVDPAIAALLQKTLGQPTRPTSEQKEREITRLKSTLTAQAPADARAGQTLFTARCAVCHKLFGQGATIGPDLTPYERRNLEFWLISIVDPSTAIREEYTNFRIDTKDDQTLVGLITQRSADSITLLDATQQKTVIPKAEIATEQALSLSIMPEGLLTDLSEAQIRDLFAFLQAEKAPR